MSEQARANVNRMKSLSCAMFLKLPHTSLRDPSAVLWFSGFRLIGFSLLGD